MEKNVRVRFAQSNAVIQVLVSVFIKEKARVRVCDPACSEADRARIQRFLSVAEVVVCDGYPRSAKAYLAQYGTAPIGETCRKAAVKDIEYNEVQRLHFAHMKGLMEDTCAALDEPVTPVTPQ